MTTLTSRDVPWHVSTFVPIYLVRTYAQSTNSWRSWRLGETSPRLGGSRHDGGLANP
jgi:hypothetical protein